MMWFFDYWKDRKDSKKNHLGFKLLVALNAFIIVAGFFLMVGGTYGSVLSIKKSYDENGGEAWSCADNSGSVQ